MFQIFTILYHTIRVLYYTILYYTILYYTILYYNILYYTTLNIEVHVSKVQSRLPPRRSTSCNEQLRLPLDRGVGWRLHCSCVLPSRTSSALAPEWGCPGGPQGLLQPRLRPTYYLLTRPRPRALRGVRHPLRDGERVGGVATVRPETTRRKQLSATIIK